MNLIQSNLNFKSKKTKESIIILLVKKDINSFQYMQRKYQGIFFIITIILGFIFGKIDSKSFAIFLNDRYHYFYDLIYKIPKMSFQGGL